MATVAVKDKESLKDVAAAAILKVMETRSFAVDSDGDVYRLLKSSLPAGCDRDRFDSAMSKLITDGMEGRKVVRRRRGRVENVSSDKPGLAIYLV